MWLPGAQNLQESHFVPAMIFPLETYLVWSMAFENPGQQSWLCSRLVRDGLQAVLFLKISMRTIGKSPTQPHSVQFYLLKHLCFPLSLSSTRYPLSQHERFYFSSSIANVPSPIEVSLIVWLLWKKASSLPYGKNLMM